MPGSSLVRLRSNLRVSYVTEFVSPYFFRTEKSKYSMVIANLNFVFPAGVCSVCIRAMVVLITTPIYEPFRRPELKEGALGSDAPGRDSTQIRLVLPCHV